MGIENSLKDPSGSPTGGSAADDRTADGSNDSDSSDGCLKKAWKKVKKWEWYTKIAAGVLTLGIPLFICYWLGYFSPKEDTSVFDKNLNDFTITEKAVGGLAATAALYVGREYLKEEPKKASEETDRGIFGFGGKTDSEDGEESDPMGYFIVVVGIIGLLLMVLCLVMNMFSEDEYADEYDEENPQNDEETP